MRFKARVQQGYCALDGKRWSRVRISFRIRNLFKFSITHSSSKHTLQLPSSSSSSSLSLALRFSDLTAQQFFSSSCWHSGYKPSSLQYVDLLSIAYCLLPIAQHLFDTDRILRGPTRINVETSSTNGHSCPCACHERHTVIGVQALDGESLCRM